MKIAVYQGLPSGGAKRSIDALSTLLEKSHQLTYFSLAPSSIKNRVLKDLHTFFIEPLKAFLLASHIDSQAFDACLVTHDGILQCPWILRFLKTPTVFLCQEPTRSYYEYFLRVDPHLPPANFLYESLVRAIRKPLERQNARAATALAVNSFYSAESVFRAFGIVAQNIYLGINQSDYFPEDTTKKNQVLTVGNDEPQKALAFTINTLALVDRKLRPTLVIASPRAYANKHLLSLAARKHVKLQIHHELDIAKMRRLYNQSRLTLCFAHLEPFGLSSVESQACATPVLAVNEAGFRETVIDKKTGFLCPRDPKILAQELTRLLSDPALLKTLGKNANKHAIKNFTWKASASSLETLLNTVTHLKRNRSVLY